MRPIFNPLLAGMLLATVALSARASDLKLEARLIWGANDDKETVKFEPVDPDLSDKLHRAFKWKNYYEITNLHATIPVNQDKDLKMSASCTLRIRNLGGERVEVSCMGKGKQVHKGAYTLTPPQWLVLGGNDSANTAWFVALRSVDGKALIAIKP